MRLNELFSHQLEREIPATRAILARIPLAASADWRPHEKSMALGYLAAHLASLPSWIDMIVKADEFNLIPGQFAPPVQTTTEALLSDFDRSLQLAREALATAEDEHLLKPWPFSVNGILASANPRHQVIADVVLSHLVHHRAQLGVYLRLLNVPVPPSYGPTADEKMF